MAAAAAVAMTMAALGVPPTAGEPNCMQFCKYYVECLCGDLGSLPPAAQCAKCVHSHSANFSEPAVKAIPCGLARALEICAAHPPPPPPSPPPPPLPTRCVDDEGCSLLGTCRGGKCACKKGWTGPVCSAADLAPLDVRLGYHNATQASWGGRPIYDPLSRKWQLMATEIKHDCPLILFQYNSMVIRAVSAGGDAGGPYHHEEVVLPPFHHNPTFVGPTPDGYYLLFFIGTDRPQGEIDCRQGIPPDTPAHPDPPLKSNGYTTMAYTKDITTGPVSFGIGNLAYVNLVTAFSLATAFTLATALYIGISLPLHDFVGGSYDPPRFVVGSILCLEESTDSPGCWHCNSGSKRRCCATTT